MKLANKVSLVTGFDSETGRAIAVALAREGSKIAGCCKSADQGQQSLRAVEEVGGEGILVTGDVSETAAAETIVKATANKYGRLDILVNYGAARRIVGSVMDVTEKDFDEEMTVDLKGLIVLSRAVIPVMEKGGGGSIVNLSSIAGSGVKGRALRSASKAGVNALTVAMASDHGHQGIRVNGLLVGPTLTAQIKSRPEQVKQLKGDAVLKRLHTPEDVGAAVLFFASDDSKNITGALLPLDAGRSLPTY
ncbi:MAG: SDR family oxidoreductase [Deltaproteobacteria bacterium]|nr:SDR family oxidoreductase [Deltaproteobacteria bacterium]